MALICIAAAACVAAFLMALAIGSNPISVTELPKLLFTSDGSFEAEIIQRLRLPRAIAAATTGALLAMSGALMQVLLRNPLADPYVLGVSGGAALGALSAIAAGAAAWLVDMGAMAGGFIAIVLVFGFSRLDTMSADRCSAVETSPRLLLTGSMLSALAMAGVSLVLSVAPQDRLRGMVFWMLGDLSSAKTSWGTLAVVPCVALVGLIFGRELNLLLRGAPAAQALGVNVGVVRIVLYLAASLAAAISVTTSGTIGFVGLVVPHALRFVIGNDQRVLLPVSGLAGAAFLLIADTMARTLIAPQQLPVGVITALVGAPIFLWLLSSRRDTR